MMVREGKQYSERETAGTDRQTRIPGKATQQGGKRAVKTHISEELGKDSISQTEVS